MDSISLVQNEHANRYMAEDPWLLEHKPEIFMSMIETAEVVAERYGISREAQDEFALESQRRTAAAQEAGRFDDEIVPISTERCSSTRRRVRRRARPSRSRVDECNRPETTLDGLAGYGPSSKAGRSRPATRASSPTELRPAW